MIVQVLSGAAILLLSILIGLKTKRVVPKDLRGQWFAVVSFMFFFLVCCILSVFIPLLDSPFPLAVITGTVFLGGACFVYIVIKLAGATIQHSINQDKDLKLYADKISRLVESTEDSIYLVDRDCRYLFINKKHLSRLGISEDGYRGKGYGDFHTPETTKRFSEIVDKVFRTGEPAQFEHNSERDNNHFLWTLSPVTESDGRMTTVSVVSKKITELKKIEEGLRALTLTDSLTGLYNRLGLLTLAEQYFKIANRTKSKVFMLYADLDNLKHINDTFGHQEGDAALREAALLLGETFRESDIVSRIGGDEFVVMLIKDAEESIASITTRLKNNLASYNAKKDRNYALSLSFGITYYDPAHPITVEELLARCDKLMYADKAGKQNPS